MAYTVLRKLTNGELLAVATVDDLDQAQQLVEGLYEYWPAAYSIWNSGSGANVAFDNTNGRELKGSCGRHPPRAAQRWLN